MLRCCWLLKADTNVVALLLQSPDEWYKSVSGQKQLRDHLSASTPLSPASLSCAYCCAAAHHHKVLHHAIILHHSSMRA
jgi:hypothetical protein